MNKYRAPIYETLLSYKKKTAGRFHVPGHKGGGMLPPGESVFRDMMSIDFTEISGLDDLHNANGIIQEAQILAADCFKSDETFFLVNGSTVGNISAVLTVCSRGDLVIVGRNVHQSVIHALYLARAQAVFITADESDEDGFHDGSGRHLEQILQQYSNVKAVIITNPDYYGAARNILPAIEQIHKYKIPVIVDEAHGAHFGFHSGLPPCAMQQGADIVIQSTHKMLAALTMGAMLHVQGTLISRKKLKSYLSMLQSSSPSYPILASLDVSRRMMHTEGIRYIEEGLNHIRYFQSELGKMPWFHTFSPINANCSPMLQDPFKIRIREATETLTGYELQQHLEKENCMAELADLFSVTLFFSPYSSREEIDRLIAALEIVSYRFRLEEKEVRDRSANIYKTIQEQQPAIPSKPYSFDLMDYRETDDFAQIPLAQAASRIAAELVSPYPPGVALLLPGETITIAMTQYLQKLVRCGVRFHGSCDPSLHTIQVLRE